MVDSKAATKSQDFLDAEKVFDWMHEPDIAHHWSIKEFKEWLNRRPLAEVTSILMRANGGAWHDN